MTTTTNRRLSANFEAANQASQRAAFERDRDAALRMLVDGDCPPRTRRIAEARLAQPGWTWAQIGTSLGLTKDQAVGAFRHYRDRLAAS